MKRQILPLTITAALLFIPTVLSQAPERPPARPKVTNPSLRAALYELREARKSLTDAKDPWPDGYKDRALESTQAAIDTVRTLLAVKDIDNFVGVERTADYYKKYADHPRLRAALEDLRDARDELKGSKQWVGKLREDAIDQIDIAVGDILTLLRYKSKG